MIVLLEILRGMRSRDVMCNDAATTAANARVIGDEESGPIRRHAASLRRADWEVMRLRQENCAPAASEFAPAASQPPSLDVAADDRLLLLDRVPAGPRRPSR